MAAVLSLRHLSYTVDAHTPGGAGNDVDSVLAAGAQGYTRSPSAHLLARVVSFAGAADQATVLAVHTMATEMFPTCFFPIVSVCLDTQMQPAINYVGLSKRATEWASLVLLSHGISTLQDTSPGGVLFTEGTRGLQGAIVILISPAMLSLPVNSL